MEKRLRIGLPAMILDERAQAQAQHLVSAQSRGGAGDEGVTNSPLHSCEEGLRLKGER